MRTKDPYEKPKFDTEPYSVYLYYFKPDQPYLRGIFFHQSKSNPATGNRLKNIVKDLVESAADLDQAPPSCERNFEWRKKSVLAIVMDDKTWRFKADGGIVFKKDGQYLDNHTFYHVEHTTITVNPKKSEKRELALLYCINHMKASLNSNDDLDENHGPQKFWFEILSDQMRVGPYEADGTNLGPPVPPPPKASFLPFLFLAKFIYWLKSLFR